MTSDNLKEKSEIKKIKVVTLEDVLINATQQVNCHAAIISPRLQRLSERADMQISLISLSETYKASPDFL